jgi:hypothetical protein
MVYRKFKFKFNFKHNSTPNITAEMTENTNDQFEYTDGIDEYTDKIPILSDAFINEAVIVNLKIFLPLFNCVLERG